MMFPEWSPRGEAERSRAIVSFVVLVLAAAVLALSGCTSTQRAGERFIPAAMGTAAGAGAGLLVGGPAGAVVGAGAGAVVTSIATPDCAELYASGSNARGIEEIRAAPGAPPVTRYEPPPARLPWKGLAGGAAALALGWWQRKRLASLVAAPARLVARLRQRHA